MDGKRILFLSHDDIVRINGLEIANIIDTIEKVISLHEESDYILPNKTVLRWGDMDSETEKGRINAMPGYIGGEFDISGIKWISSAPNNPFKYNLPRASGLIILNDPDTLVPMVVMDATYISSMRTGAVSGVVAKYLANEESKTLGLIGAGVQNRTQLMALYSTLPNLSFVKVFDINKDRAFKFSEEMKSLIPIEIEVVSSAEECVRSSDIFVTATVSKDPIVKKDWIESGSLYIHVGSHECEFDVIHNADKVVVDDWEELKHRGVETISIMYKQGLYDESNLYAELGEIVNGKKRGRENNDEKIYFNSVGMGIEDVAVAKLIYEKAKEKNIGQWLTLWDSPIFV